MKTSSILRIISTGIFISILLLAGLSLPAWAVRGINLSPTEGAIGTLVTISGTEFNKSTADVDRYAAIYFSSDEASTIDDINVEVTHYKLVKEGVWLDEKGDFETTFIVPDQLDDGSKSAAVTSGTYYVYVCHYVGTIVQPRIRAVATFTVTMGEIALYPLRGKVGTQIEIDGINFAGNKPITIKYDGSVVPINAGNNRTGFSGGFTSIIRIPESIGGSHKITATVAGDEATQIFNVEPDIVSNPTSGKTGETVIVSGTGFSKLKTVTVWLYNTAVTMDTTNILGSFYISFEVPDLPAGIYNVDAEEGINIAKAKFTITAPAPSPPPPPPPPEPSASISISASTGSIGQGVVMGGAGFKPNATVTVIYDDALLTAVTTDAGGVFAAAFAVPPSQSGNHKIIVSDGTVTEELIFAVEATPPPVPSLLLPPTGEKVTSPIRFDWQDVTDPSLPVTYTFQISTSPDFSTAATVLEKTGLTRTEYSVTEEESLRLGAGEKPYYWRVRAIDGASNEGNWANTWTFYIVSGGIPTWAIIVLAVIGGVLLLALGYFINMKTGSSRL